MRNRVRTPLRDERAHEREELDVKNADRGREHRGLGAAARAHLALADDGELESRPSAARRAITWMMLLGALVSAPLFWASTAQGDDGPEAVAVLAKGSNSGPGGDDGGDDDGDGTDLGGTTDAGGDTSGRADTRGTTAGTGDSATQAGTREGGATDVRGGDTSAGGDDTGGTTAATGASVTQAGTGEGGATDVRGGDTSAGGEDTAGTTAGTGASVTND